MLKGGEVVEQGSHAQLLSQLSYGILHARVGPAGEAVAYFVAEGFVEAAGGRVVVLAERADRLESLDKVRAQASLADAERRLAGLALDTEEHPIQEKRRRRAQARLLAIAVRDA